MKKPFVKNLLIYLFKKEVETKETLPIFKYFPDPVAAGSIIESDNECVCCGRKRGYIYTESPSCIEELEKCICPWCIADGSAHKKYDAEFSDSTNIGHLASNEWSIITNEIIEEVAFRTPGFSGWQQEKWWSHCDDACEFIEVGGYKEIQKYGKDLEEWFKNQLRSAGCKEKDMENYIKNLSKDGSPTAYIFRCRHCGKYGGYYDCD